MERVCEGGALIAPFFLDSCKIFTVVLDLTVLLDCVVGWLTVC